MSKPEGYRKALRMMNLAEKFGRPVITIIDTPGAYPGIDAEERGQAEAIAFNLREMAGLKVPIIVLVLGEGGSGGALAIGIGDRVLMMENAVYSVITPEGCAAILWKSADKAPEAAEGLKLTAAELKKHDIVDEIIPEETVWTMPGEDDKKQQKAYDRVCENLKKSLVREVKALTGTDTKILLDNRYNKFRKMGEWV
jgi:acetyl-CoA carboxylase carboxyl transferase subunit alpha